MTNVFKIHTRGVPEYLLNIVPMKREHVSSYITRNKEGYIIPRCRLQLFRNSFIHDGVVSVRAQLYSFIANKLLSPRVEN